MTFLKLRSHVVYLLCSQHCTLDLGSYTKDLSIVNEDLSSVFILDNSPGAYRHNPGNSNKHYDTCTFKLWLIKIKTDSTFIFLKMS